MTKKGRQFFQGEGPHIFSEEGPAKGKSGPKYSVKCPCNNFIKYHFSQYFVNNNNNTVSYRTPEFVSTVCS